MNKRNGLPGIALPVNLEDNMVPDWVDCPEYQNELIRTLELIKDTPTEYFYNKLHEETGEVAEVASAWMGSEAKVKKLLKKHDDLTEAMLEELGDTLNVVMILAARHDLSFDEVVDMGRRKLKKKNDKRDK